ncbi:hypothetical protein DPX16_8607 [Anabarilius grahami]|uniref:Uncharacterized protein n=1 Tax=Anabarilius grahami TaxID=495550 RepID=A0A3N0YA95_ANAGA|nr:hypothetical protein DPX16_8607 [Anabarilius grahami]
MGPKKVVKGDDMAATATGGVNAEEPLVATNVYVKVQGQTYLLEVGLSPELPYPVVLGQDLPVLFDLLPLQAFNAAVTQAMAKSGEEEVGLLGALPFFEADLEAEPGKTRKSRSQRRCEQCRFKAALKWVCVCSEFSVKTQCRIKADLKYVGSDPPQPLVSKATLILF